MTAKELLNRAEDLLYDELEEAGADTSDAFDSYEEAVDAGKGDNELSAYLRHFIRARERANTIRRIIKAIHSLGDEIDE